MLALPSLGSPSAQSKCFANTFLGAKYTISTERYRYSRKDLSKNDELVSCT